MHIWHLSVIRLSEIASKGNPSVNHKFYGTFHVDHQLLHAYRLEFPDGRVFTAPMPEIFKEIMEKERG